MRTPNVGIPFVVAAAAAGGQLLLADVLDLLWRGDGSLAGGSGVPGGFISVAWFSAGGVVAGVVAGVAVAAGRVGACRWPVVTSAAAGALAGAASYAGVALGQLSGSPPADGNGTGTVGGTLAASVCGVFVGAAFGIAACRHRSVARGLLVWTAWVWLVMIQCVALPVYSDLYPLGVPDLDEFVESPALSTLVTLAAVVPAAGLGWWAVRRGDARPVSGGAAGPVLMLAAHVAVLLFGLVGWNDDHYSAGADLAVWVCLSLYAIGAAAFGALAAGAWRRAVPGRATGTALLGWGAVLLAIAFLDRDAFGVTAAAVGTLTGAVGLATARGRRLRIPAGMLAAVTGPVGLYLAGLAGFGDYTGDPPLAVEASRAADLPPAAFGAVLGGAALLGACARGPRSAVVAATGGTIMLAVAAMVQ